MPLASIGIKRGRSPAGAATIATENAPAISLPLRFIAAGLVALGVAAAWLVHNPSLITNYHYSPHVVAFTHLVLLGFIASIVMGVLYQLAPVTLDARLHSERLARIHFWLHVAGVAGMVWMFRKWDMKQVGHFGTVFGVGVGLFIYNLARTLARMPRWTAGACGIASAVGWLAITMLAGLFLACAKCWPWTTPFAPLAQMHAHAHLGGLGVFVILTVSVAYRLVPMFVISGVQSPRRAGWSIALLNAGLVALVPAILWQSPWKLAAALVIITGLALFGVELAAIVRARKRYELDWGLRYFLTGMWMLAPVALLAIVLSWPGLPATVLTMQLENAYALLAVFGVLGFAVLGMLGKILPFLVWFHCYREKIGRHRVPSLTDMYSARLQAIGYWLHLTGVIVAPCAAVLGHPRCAAMAASLIAASVLLFGINALRIASHLVRRPALELLMPARAACASA